MGREFLMRSIKVCLVGHSFCSRNLGVGALAFGEVDVIRAASSEKELKCYIECLETNANGRYSNTPPDVKIREYNIKHLLRNISLFKEFDLVIDISGGDSFSDIYGAKLYLLQVLIKLAILISGTPYIIAPQTLGPYSNPLTKLFAEIYIAKSYAAFARDELSRYAVGSRVRDKIVDSVDLGFSMLCEKKRTRQGLVVGFNVSGLIYNQAKFDESDRYHALCDVIIRHLKQIGAQVLLIPHVVGRDPSGVDNDFPVCMALAKRHGLPTVPFFENPVEAKEYISQCDLFIGSRMHATIGAVSMEVSTLPLAYSMKFKGVFETIGYSCTLDLSKASNDKVLRTIDEMLANGSRTASDLHGCMERVKEKREAYKRCLRTAFDSFAR